MFTSDVLTAPVKISGQPVANLIASTSGTDADWVVKLIDVYPDEVAGQPEMGGYQLMVVGRHLPRPLSREPRDAQADRRRTSRCSYRFALPTANHVFLPGHRIMVQVQSSWFPLYDRNPQTFVPNIFWAKPADYRKAVQRIYHAPGRRASSSCRWCSHERRPGSPPARRAAARSRWPPPKSARMLRPACIAQGLDPERRQAVADLVPGDRSPGRRVAAAEADRQRQQRRAAEPRQREGCGAETRRRRRDQRGRDEGERDHPRQQPEGRAGGSHARRPRRGRGPRSPPPRTASSASAARLAGECSTPFM